MGNTMLDIQAKACQDEHRKIRTMLGFPERLHLEESPRGAPLGTFCCETLRRHVSIVAVKALPTRNPDSSHSVLIGECWRTRIVFQGGLLDSLDRRRSRARVPPVGKDPAKTTPRRRDRNHGQELEKTGFCGIPHPRFPFVGRGWSRYRAVDG